MKTNIKRDQDNLIEGLDYPFDENGKIIWRKLIRNEHLVPNKDRTQETDITLLEDKDILVLLAGFKELANIHGFTRISYKFPASTQEFVSCVCKIDYIPSYHTEMRTISFESTADASYNNTQSINGKYFLTTTAENRAFVRNVRNFLQIPILGKDEFFTAGKKEEELDTPSPNNPKSIALKKMKDMGFNTFVDAKKALWTIGVNSFDEYEKLNDIPIEKIMSLIGALNKIGK